LSNPNAEPSEPRSRRDALSDLQARVEAAIDDVRPKIRRALDELDAKVDAAVADLKPRAKSAMREVQPKVDKLMADVQPRLDAILERLQAKIDDLRRDLDARASRRTREEAGTTAGEIGPGSETRSEGGTDESGGTSRP
jgi:hypothetical protein